jgi:hypothetical protein
VIEPTHMPGVLYGVAREAKGDNLVDLPARPVFPDICQTSGEVSSELSAEPVLRCQDEVSLMTAIFEGLNGAAGDDEMATLDKRDV